MSSPQEARSEAPQASAKPAIHVRRQGSPRIARSTTARRDFQKSYPCPSTGKTTGACKGYVIDHVVPLKRGGADAPGNMQWQTVQAAKGEGQSGVRRSRWFTGRLLVQFHPRFGADLNLPVVPTSSAFTFLSRTYSSTH
jgi:hypothetical protein